MTLVVIDIAFQSQRISKRENLWLYKDHKAQYLGDGYPFSGGSCPHSNSWNLDLLRMPSHIHINLFSYEYLYLCVPFEEGQLKPHWKHTIP